MKYNKIRIIAMSLVIASAVFGGVFLNGVQAGPFGRYGVIKNVVLDPGSSSTKQCLYSLTKRECDMRTYNQQ
tara:strand:- start:468 stop:683 length:216 start_codon:yes stop_codon:yes gene_type:complete